MRVKRGVRPVRRSIDAAELVAAAHRPGDRCGAQLDLRLDLVEQFERLAAGPVVLVEERDHRQVARSAHLEQLQRLALDALRRVEHHHDGVDGGQHAVGVLAEVAVARRVEQVDGVLAVRELQHGGADGDAALLLELHPVAARAAPALAGVHRAGLLHRAGVQQELLGERRLAGVGVADDGERASLAAFGGHVHGRSRLSFRRE